MTHKLLNADALTALRKLPSQKFNACITSPPYFGLRDYGVPDQIGLERSPQEYVDKLVIIFREVRRVLRDDGTLWLNLGDSYAGSGRGGNPEAGTKQGTNRGSQTVGVLYGREQESKAAERERMKQQNAALYTSGLKPKDLIGIPWRVAFAFQQDGWYLRQDIVWHKPNPMPESVRDRCTKAHEYLFLFSKNEKYYFDSDAIAEEAKYKPGGAHDDVPQGGFNDKGPIPGSGQRSFRAIRETRNRRSVWSIPTKPFKEAHFATFPPALVEPCVLAGSPINGFILDPFAGAGTTGLVASQLNRHCLMIELNPQYCEIINRRLTTCTTSPTPPFPRTIPAPTSSAANAATPTQAPGKPSTNAVLFT